MNSAHIKLIHELFALAEARGLPLWLESGWAVDARLNKVTRTHEDIDLAVPAERAGEFRALLAESFGVNGFEQTGYGFLASAGGVLLDCEPCTLVEGRYELDGAPRGSCPDAKQGVIHGVPVRCTSWEAILWEYFHYLEEVPYLAWPAKDRESYRLVREVVGEPEAGHLHAAFLSGGPR